MIHFEDNVGRLRHALVKLHDSSPDPEPERLLYVRKGEFRVHEDGRVDAALAYAPFSQEAELPDEVIEQINDYDPELQCVFAMIDSEGKASVLTLNASEHMGSTPQWLYEDAIKRQQHVPSLPGTVVRLNDYAGDIEPGWFVFLGEEKSEMILSPAGEDEDGEIVATEEVHRVHVDFWEKFEVTRITGTWGE